jgi:hypothetical protein
VQKFLERFSKVEKSTFLETESFGLHQTTFSKLVDFSTFEKKSSFFTQYVTRFCEHNPLVKTFFEFFEFSNFSNLAVRHVTGQCGPPDL